MYTGIGATIPGVVGPVTDAQYAAYELGVSQSSTSSGWTDTQVNDLLNQIGSQSTDAANSSTTSKYLTYALVGIGGVLLFMTFMGGGRR